MLKLNVYGSSSKGNCYFLTNGNDTLCLDLGVKKLDNLDWNNVSGIIITHVHNDHCGGIKDIKNYYKGKYYSNKETLDKIPIIDEYKQEVIGGEKFSIGTFDIVAFDLYHDVKCYGYLIKDTISNTKILYITDTGHINYKFKDIYYFLIESNNVESELTFEDYKEVRLYDTHLSMEQTSRFLKENINHNTKKIILCHISHGEQNYIRHQDYVKEQLENEDIEVIALDPHLKNKREIILKEDIGGFDFD